MRMTDKKILLLSLSSRPVKIWFHEHFFLNKNNADIRSSIMFFRCDKQSFLINCENPLMTTKTSNNFAERSQNCYIYKKIYKVIYLLCLMCIRILLYKYLILFFLFLHKTIIMIQIFIEKLICNSFFPSPLLLPVKIMP